MSIIKTPLKNIEKADTPIIESLKMRIQEKIKKLDDSERLKYNNVYKKTISENNNKKMIKEFLIILGIIIACISSISFLEEENALVSIVSLVLSFMFYMIIFFIPKYSQPSKEILNLYSILNFNLKYEMNEVLMEYTAKNLNSKSKYVEYMIDYYFNKIKRITADKSLIERELLTLLCTEDLKDPEYKNVSNKLIVETKIEHLNKELNKMKLKEI